MAKSKPPKRTVPGAEPGTSMGAAGLERLERGDLRAVGLPVRSILGTRDCIFWEAYSYTSIYSVSSQTISAVAGGSIETILGSCRVLNPTDTVVKP